MKFRSTNLFDCELEDFYTGFNADEYSSLTSLVTALHNLIDDHTVISYADARFALEVIDAQGSGVRGVYSLETKTEWATGENAWNREHVWPRSKGLGDTGPDHSDLHNLFACDVNLNSARGNKYFDYCSLEERDCVEPAGTSSEDAHFSTREDSETWTPPESMRGDLARVIFYMAIRYDGNEPSTSNLVIEDCSNTSCPENSFGRLSTLLHWHEADPVSEEEIERNNKICSEYQGNRNPFIDYPFLVDKIFGTNETFIGGPSIDESTILSSLIVLAVFLSLFFPISFFAKG
eukprot:snap_masked-scaffold_4-processed-gene-6.10-mRNA-1 protein AED:0.15 eAED:0.16 QI:0/0/0/0.5/1/1/2/0/290